MTQEELYNGRYDGKVINLPDFLPNEVHIPYVNIDIIDEIENGDDPTQPIATMFHQAIYKLNTNELKYKYSGEVK